MNSPLPLVVLAGSDPEPPSLPDGSNGLHPLRGAKAIAVKIDRRPLLDVLLERLRECGEFDPIFLAGPGWILGSERGGAAVIDTDASFRANLEAAVDHVTALHEGPVAFTTCDIVPDVDELRSVMADYRQSAPLDFWFPVIEAPVEDQLGASAWKPRYRMIPSGSEAAVSILPSHLVVVELGALRLQLVYRSFQLAYESRNTRVMRRLRLILGGVFLYLLGEDLRKLMRLRLPTKTVTVVYHGVALALALRGEARQETLEKRIGGIFVRHRHRRSNPGLGGRIPLMRALSLAKDIDTQEEAEEMSHRLV